VAVFDQYQQQVEGARTQDGRVALHQQLPLLGPDFEMAKSVKLLHASAGLATGAGYEPACQPQFLNA
jgi:hypothetical protein